MESQVDVDLLHESTEKYNLVLWTKYKIISNIMEYIKATPGKLLTHTSPIYTIKHYASNFNLILSQLALFFVKQPLFYLLPLPTSQLLDCQTGKKWPYWQYGHLPETASTVNHLNLLCSWSRENRRWEIWISLLILLRATCSEITLS